MEYKNLKKSHENGEVMEEGLETKQILLFSFILDHYVRECFWHTDKLSNEQVMLCLDKNNLRDWQDKGLHINTVKEIREYFSQDQLRELLEEETDL